MQKGDEFINTITRKNGRFRSAFNDFKKCVDITNELLENGQIILLIGCEKKVKFQLHLNEPQFAEKYPGVDFQYFQYVLLEEIACLIEQNVVIPESVTEADGVSFVQNDKQTDLLHEIIESVQKLEKIEDFCDQISHCAYICNKMLQLLNRYGVKQKDNYCRKLWHLFYQAIKRNYAKQLFTKEQLALMLNMLMATKTLYVEEEIYWQFDEQLYHYGLDVFPEEE